MNRHTRTLIEILVILGATCARGDVLGVELVGFGEKGPSRTYTAERWIPLRYRIQGAEATGAPVDVILRRDDGATTVIPGQTSRNSALEADVPLRPGNFSLNEYEAFAIEPGGRIHQSRSLSVIHVGAGSVPGELAGQLEEARSRLGPSGSVNGPPTLLAADPLFQEGSPLDSGAFEASLVAGADLEVHPASLD